MKHHRTPLSPQSRGNSERRSAFTLIELLVVIGIVSLMVAMLLPMVRKAHDAVQRIHCASNLRGIGNLITLYAMDNHGQLFPHRQSLTYPTWYDSIFLGGGWDRSNPVFTPIGERTSMPTCTSYLRVISNGQGWEQMGGSDGFYALLYPKYIQDGQIFTCPANWSAQGGGTAADAGEFDFRTVQRAIDNGTTWYFVSSYIGNMYGPLSTPASERGFGFWSSYFIQGYYPYLPDYRAPRGAMMWDVGAYTFEYGFNNSGLPAAPFGCHYYGGNFLMADGSVQWARYSWIKQ